MKEEVILGFLFFRFLEIRKLLAAWHPNLRVFSIKGRKSDRLICA